ncbi:MAG: RtcB family protein [Saprospiraceae bacterium]|nr:RtcB family protein [Saprospiraceae bacterium]
MELKKIKDCLWEIPKSYRKGMKVAGHVYAMEELLPALTKDRSLDQLCNVAMLPGIQMAAIVMPDAHEGYGFPIGGVAATRYPDGVISPGGIGYDINCGVRLLRTDLRYREVSKQMEALSKALYDHIPSGMGKGGNVKLNMKEVDKVLRDGAEWAITNHFGLPHDLEFTESLGRLKPADHTKVSNQAKKRGHDQLGTIGSGNHFVEVDRIDEIYDEEAARAFGLFPDQIVVLIHTGSRGLGHQVATDYLRLMTNVMAQYGISLPDRELACVPFNSIEGKDYFGAMCAAANFAWCNRQIITHEVRRALTQIFGRAMGPVDVVYDVAHNIAKVETHTIEGEKKKVIVHRKGATRAFGPGFEELPEIYRAIGQPVFIPGSMGTASFVLAGTLGSMEASFGSTCHGAGRAMSRRAAKKVVDAPSLLNELKEKNIHIQAGSYRGAAEEAPVAYKDVDLVVETVHKAGIAKKVARLRPHAVIKG